MRRRLIDAMGGVPGVRWQNDAQLHLTLRFIGEVDPRVAEDVAAALGTVTGPPPTIALAGTDVFTRKGMPHTLWAGVTHDAALTILQGRIERALVDIGLVPEQRGFKPHITLARLNRSAGPPETFLHATALLRSAPATMDAFLLFESRLGGDGAKYEEIARYPLA